MDKKDSCQKISLLTEYMTNGDLYRILYHDKQKENESDKILQWIPATKQALPTVSVLSDIALSIVYLHSFQPAYLHHDLQSRNVLFTSLWEAKLGGIRAIVSTESDLLYASDRISTDLITAPEVLKGEERTEKSDIYSFGILMAEIDLCHNPYLKDRDAEQLSSRDVAELVVADLLKPSFTPSCPKEIQDIAKKCLAYESWDRPTAVQMEFWLRRMKSATSTS